MGQILEAIPVEQRLVELAALLGAHLRERRMSDDLPDADGIGSPGRRSVLKPPIICQVTGSPLTADQVAELLGVPQRWVYGQSRARRIPTVTLGRRYRHEAIDAWVAGIEVQMRAAGARAAVGSWVELRSQSAVGTATRSHAATGVRR